MSENQPAAGGTDFIRALVDEHLRTGEHGGKVVTRFPPEPNGYLHIGHAKSICLNFGVAHERGGKVHLRFDDTNPTTEDPEYVESIQQDVRWLGFEWDEGPLYASDYFEQLYQFAIRLIEAGKAYVCSNTEEEIREMRGTVTQPGVPSKGRERSVETNLDLFRRMRAGEFEDGAHVLRARLDMAHPNMKMRDPLLYRIRKAHHYRTGDEWPIYPMYDYAHCLSDAIEGITHSICTLEFENNRDIYDWAVDTLIELGVDFDPRPRQYEFARLRLTYTVMSKRKLLALVEGGYVSGWDDPRMPTIAGMRRRGVRPEALRTFCDRIGVAKANSTVDLAQFEHTLRDDLNHVAPRVLGVVDPLKVTLTNWPEGEVDTLDAASWPHDVPKEGSRPLAFGRQLWIERSDFAKDPPKGFKRLVPGGEVRLRHAYVIRCDEVVEEGGEVTELRCSVDRTTRGGKNPEGRKVKGTIHWASAAHAVACELRLYDRLFSVEDPGQGKGQQFLDELNPDSLKVAQGWVEPALAEAEVGDRFQLERLGYFRVDEDSAPGKLVLNRIVTLKDGWAKARSSTQPAASPRTSRPAPAAPAAPAGPARPDAHEKDPARMADFRRLVDEVGLGEDEAAVLAQTAELVAFYDQARGAVGDADGAAEALAKWVVNEVLALVEGVDLSGLTFTGAALGSLVRMRVEKTLSGKAAKAVLEVLAREGGDPAAIAEREGLTGVVGGEALAAEVDAVLAENPDNVEKYKGGKTGLLGFFVGQVMKRTRGKADAKAVNSLLKERLEG